MQDLCLCPVADSCTFLNNVLLQEAMPQISCFTHLTENCIIDCHPSSLHYQISLRPQKIAESIYTHKTNVEVLSYGSTSSLVRCCIGLV